MTMIANKRRNPRLTAATVFCSMPLYETVTTMLLFKRRRKRGEFMQYEFFIGYASEELTHNLNTFLR